jgi:hypothetical protein
MQRAVPRARAGAHLALAGLVLATAGRGHIVTAGPTLHQLVFGAEVVGRARILGTGEEIELAGGELRRPFVEAELVEVWKGPLAPGPIRFAQHGHGVAPFEAGQEVVVFLRASERTRELRELAGAGGLAWVSTQEHDDAWTLAEASHDGVRDAIRGYVALEGESDPARRVEGLRRLTLGLLRASDTRLAESALQDLVRSAGAPLLRREDLPALAPILDDPGAPLGLRAGLLAELERRGLLAGDAHWVRLVETARASDLPAAVRAAGAHPSPAVTARLVRVLEASDARAAEAAAIALGSPGNAAAVEPLAKALATGDARLRGAAIRGLGRIALPEARRALESAARGHADPATRRRAEAELRATAGGA